MRSFFFVALQYLLPRFWLTAAVYKIARIKSPGIKNFLITRFVRLYSVDTDEIKLALPGDFKTFNEFFIRELKDSARAVDTAVDSIIAPVDGTVSEAGTLHGRRILQAKGIDYSVLDLLATDVAEAGAFTDGQFATIYLAPYNYHRVHAPLDGELVAARYVPGDLFSVNDATAARVRGLFRRNERLILHFTTRYGRVAVILVGALNVGSISTPWSGEIRPRKTGVVETINLSGQSTQINKGDLLGWFNMGSTVILLLPPGACDWQTELQAGDTLRMGQTIGTLSDGSA